MTVSQVELARLGGLPLHRLDQLIASGRAPVYARPPSRRVACYTLHEAVMLATGVLLHERSGLGWPLIHHALALNPDLFVDPLDEADGATGLEERWLAVNASWPSLTDRDPLRSGAGLSWRDRTRMSRGSW